VATGLSYVQGKKLKIGGPSVGFGLRSGVLTEIILHLERSYREKKRGGNVPSGEEVPE